MSNYNAFAVLDSDDEDIVENVVKNVSDLSVETKSASKAKDTKTTVRKTSDDKRKPSKIDNERNGARKGKGKREFDRRSGTGRGHENPKQGGGAHNWGKANEDGTSKEGSSAAGGEWGTAESEAQDNTTGLDSVIAEAEGASAGTKLAGENQNEGETVVEEEEEVETMTYEEYMALKEAERSSSEIFAPREVRTVENAFGGSQALTKDGKTPDFMEPLYEKVHTKKTSGRKKQLFDDVGFRTPNRRRNDFGGRGGRREFSNDGKFEGKFEGKKEAGTYEKSNEEKERSPRTNGGFRGERRGRGGRGERGGRGDRGGRGGRGERGRGGRTGGSSMNVVPNPADMNMFPSL